MENFTKDIDVLQKTPGQILKAAREDSGISIDKVAQVLLLNKSIINALEADDYSNIVAKVYAEGYLKAYAAFLQLPAIEVLESFRHINAYNNKSEIKPIKAIRSNNDTDNSAHTNLLALLKNTKFIMLLTIVGLFCLVLVAVINKHSLVKTLEESVLSTNSTTDTAVFPIEINNNLVSAPQVEPVAVPKNTQKIPLN